MEGISVPTSVPAYTSGRNAKRGSFYESGSRNLTQTQPRAQPASCELSTQSVLAQTQPAGQIARSARRRARCVFRSPALRGPCPPSRGNFKQKRPGFQVRKTDLILGPQLSIFKPSCFGKRTRFQGQILDPKSAPRFLDTYVLIYAAEIWPRFRVQNLDANSGPENGPKIKICGAEIKAVFRT